jgi:antitoxin VapB
MTQELIARSFKSGNSVALRLPKALGIAPGEDLVIVPLAGGGLNIWKKSDTRNVFMGLFGSVSPGFMADGRDDIDQAAYDWQPSGDHTAAA